MGQNYRPLPGTPQEDLDTPCLILDMDAVDHNMDVMAGYYAGQASELRPHGKNHKTPALAHRQIRRAVELSLGAGGPVGLPGRTQHIVSQGEPELVSIDHVGVDLDDLTGRRLLCSNRRAL